MMWWPQALEFRSAWFQSTFNSHHSIYLLGSTQQTPCPRHNGISKIRTSVGISSPGIPLWDLVEEKLDLWDIWELLFARFLRTAVSCSGKVTCTDSVDAARLMDFRESEESLLPWLRDSSSSDSSLSVPLSVMSSSSHKPWHWENMGRGNSDCCFRWGSWCSAL